MKTLIFLGALLLTSCIAPDAGSAAGVKEPTDTLIARPAPSATSLGAALAIGASGELHSLVLGGGCFWCLEAVFELVKGVSAVESGYAGGNLENPSYEQVISGRTGHAEVVNILFDPTVLSLDELFDLFFQIHDPTTKDRQGADIGPQYRSIILYADEAQKLAAEAAFSHWAPQYSRAIVTELVPLVAFWPAEEYHQDFFQRNPEYGYCQVVVAPKVQKALQLLGE
jgi:peptide-methionine (S)-S-oxide reductase